MASARQVVLCVGLALALTGRAASAQTVVAGAGIARDVQRFPGDAAQNRLDGDSRAWTVLGGIALAHLAIRIEQSSATPIVSDQILNVDIDGRSATIQSTLTHTIRATTALGGFHHAIGSRFQLSYLGGVSFAHVERTFTTNAPGIILVPPSSSSLTSTTVVDDFAAIAIGADAVVRMLPHLGLIAGIRWQPIRLSGDVSGSSTRPLVGAVWIS